MKLKMTSVVPGKGCRWEGPWPTHPVGQLQTANPLPALLDGGHSALLIFCELYDRWPTEPTGRRRGAMRGTDVLAMKFAPARAAGIFALALMAPPILAVAIFARSAPLALSIVLICPIAFCVFWAGARVAGRQHTVKSIALAVLITWSFTYSTNGLSKQLFASVPYAGWIDVLLQFVFVFMVAWRFAPKVPTSAGFVV